MRIMLTTDPIGGVWTFNETLARGLLGAGHGIALVSFGGPASPAQVEALQALRIEFAPNFSFVLSEAPLEWMQENDRVWSEGCGVLERVCQEFSPQIIHSSQMCFGHLRLGIPVLVTAHSDVLSWADATLGPKGVERLERTTSTEWLRTYRTLVKNGLRDAAAVVAPTQWMAKTLADAFDLKRMPGVIWNGVPQGTSKTTERKLRAVTAGRLWDRGKGLSILDKLPLPLPFWVVGEPGQVDREEMRGGAQWMGPLPHEELIAIFAESAMYVASSVYEPFGLTPIEAAVQGCAIVARDIPSFREVWGDAAYYFDSAASLQQILDSLTSHQKRLQGAQCRARKRAALFTEEATTESYLTLYEDLLARVHLVHEPVFAHV